MVQNIVPLHVFMQYEHVCLKLSSSWSRGTWPWLSLLQDSGTSNRTLPPQGKACSVFVLTYFYNEPWHHGRHQAKMAGKEPFPCQRVFFLHMKQYLHFQQNYRKSFALLATETWLLTGFIKLYCQIGCTHADVISSASVCFSFFKKSVPELSKHLFNLPEKLNPPDKNQYSVLYFGLLKG